MSTVSLEQVVERGMFGIHLGLLHGRDHDLGDRFGAVRALHRCLQPIIAFGLRSGTIPG
jgi:hypothetical protein